MLLLLEGGGYGCRGELSTQATKWVGIAKLKTRICNATRCCISRCRHMQKKTLVLSSTFLGRYWCALQQVPVACNFVLLHTISFCCMQEPAALPAHPNNNTIHTQHIIIHKAPFERMQQRTGTSATTDRRESYGYAHSTSYIRVVKAVKNVSRVFLRGFVKKVVDVSVPQIAVQLFVVPKVSSQTESCSVP